MDLTNKIYTIRGKQVMLDRDLAELYGVKSIRLREQVKRNIERFPEDFMFLLDVNEINSMVSQNAIPSKKHLGGYSPYVFTEQGVASLSGALKSKKAVQINIQIMRAFVTMRKFITSNTQIFSRLDNLEIKQLEHDKNFEKVFEAIESKTIKPSKGIFYNGQIFAAYKFLNDLIKSAKKSIILIDNYIDESILALFSENNIDVTIYTKNLTEKLKLDLKKYNSQYHPITIREFNNSHDRFLIIDSSTVYHFGASLKDLGKKWFAFSKFDKDAASMLSKLD